GNTFSFQELSSSDEIIEGVLLLSSPPGIMPGFSVLTSSPDVCDSIDPALLDPRHCSRRIEGNHGNTKSPIGREHSRRGSRHVRATNDKNWHLRAVLGRVEVLLHQDIGQIDRDLRLCPGCLRIGSNVVAVDGGGCIVAGKDKESLIIVRSTIESTGATDARQLDDAVWPAVNRIALNLCLCVVHIRDNEATANKRTKFKHSVLSLRDELNKHRFRIGEVYCHKPASLCALLRKQEKP